MKQIVKKVFLFIFLSSILVGVVLYGRGYRLNLNQKGVQSTGILVITSYPDGAKIYIDGKLKGATNTTISLLPGEYTVRIEKEGLIPWERKITMKGEWVIKLGPSLFPKNPALTPITNLGITYTKIPPNADSMILFSQTGSIEDDGIYLLDLNKPLIPLTSPLRQIANRKTLGDSFDLASASAILSPDEKQIQLNYTDPNTTLTKSYLLDTDKLNPSLFEITQSISNIYDSWTQKEQKKLKKLIESLKKPLSPIAKRSFSIISFSPDLTKVAYIALEDITLPLVIKPKLIATNQTPETRTIQKGNMYVYDKKEDKNYLIAQKKELDILPKSDKKELFPYLFTSTPTPFLSSQTPTPQDQVFIKTSYEITKYYYWYPDSTQIVKQEKNKILIMEFDGTQKRTIYAGPFKNNLSAVSSDGKLLILLNLNPESSKYPDVYSVGIR